MKKITILFCILNIFFFQTINAQFNIERNLIQEKNRDTFLISTDNITIYIYDYSNEDNDSVILDLNGLRKKYKLTKFGNTIDFLIEKNRCNKLSFESKSIGEQSATLGFKITEKDNILISDSLMLDNNRFSYFFLNKYIKNENEKTIKQHCEQFISEALKNHMEVFNNLEKKIKKKLPKKDYTTLIEQLNKAKINTINILKTLIDKQKKEFISTPTIDIKKYFEKLKTDSIGIKKILNDYTTVIENNTSAYQYISIFGNETIFDPIFVHMSISDSPLKDNNVFLDSIFSLDSKGKIAYNINFNNGSDCSFSDSSEAMEIISAISNYMNYNQETKIIIEGHTDCIRLKMKNDVMLFKEILKEKSYKRADTIKTEIIKRGIFDERIKIIGYGADYPIIECIDSINEHPENRRIEVKFDKYFTIKSLEDKKTPTDSLISTVPLNLWSDKTFVSELKDPIPTAALCYITDVSELIFETINKYKVQDHWYKINYKQKNGTIISGWIYGFYTNKKYKENHIGNIPFIQGDSLESIANKYKISVEWLKYINPRDTKPETLKPGVFLYIINNEPPYKTKKQLKNK